MIVSYDAEYSFTFTRSRSLMAHFVVPNSVGSIITNADGSRGVVFWQSPDGDETLLVALNDVSEGCTWGPNQNVEPLEDWLSATPELLNDMDGQSNTQILRDWFENNTEYAACKTDFENGWYLPSAGQLRKLYAALPMVESIIINANGTLMTENDYWSSTERGSGTAWTPSFAMGYNNKGTSCRVRAIYGLVNTQYVTQSTTLGQGTNWFSTYLDITLEDLQAALAAATPNKAITIKSADGRSSVYSPRTHAWTGQLTYLDLAMRYNIIVAEACEITLAGTPINPADHPITILGNGQTTWIGVPLNESMSLGTAFAGFAINGDKIKSGIGGNATYARNQWFGQLTTLEPGQGYIYTSAANAADRVFVFPSSKK